MIVTPNSLAALFTSFRKNYQDGLASIDPQWSKVATLIPSTGKQTTYGWLGKFGKFREWVGDRVFNNLKAHAYTVVNKKFELSVEVERDEIEDDEVGAYGIVFKGMGESAAEFPDEQVFPLLAAGFASLCYDGQNFFDSDHPVYPNADGTGTAVTVSNMQAGTGAPWFLLDTSRALKPIIFQERRKIEFHAMLKPEQSESVWLRDAYQYGADGRSNVGFGLWQMAFGSKATPSVENLRAAQAAMESFKADGDKPLNIKPKMVVCGPTNRAAFEDILDKQNLDGGGSNPMYKKFELLVVPYLT